MFLPSTGVIFVTFAFSLLPIALAYAILWLFERRAHRAQLLVRHDAWLFPTAIIVGALGGVIFGVLVAPSWRTQPLVSSAVVSPITEEFGKGLLVLGLFLFGRLRTRADGLLLGIAAGAGFASFENLLYGLRGYAEGGADAWWLAVRVRLGYGTLIHVASSALYGAVLGESDADGRRMMILAGPFAALVAGFTVHGAWNFCLEMSSLDGPHWAIAAQIVAFCALLSLLGLVTLELKRRAGVRTSSSS